jgi:uncharacterized protein YbjT (DUF2867 family)
MKKLLHFGASGNIGRSIAAELKQRNFDVTVVVRNTQKLDRLNAVSLNHIIADVTKAGALKGICNGFDIVLSSLGKSVSPNDKSKASFRDIDFVANCNILSEAITSGVQKFVYLSVFHAEKYPHLEYFKSHFDFEEKLKTSGIDYTIIRPPAVFSSFIDLMHMAKRGSLITIGKGDKRTNPIYEGDLAKICVNAIDQPNAIVEAGGKEILTRKEINEIIQKLVAPGKKLKSVPLGMIKTALPLIKLFDRNAYDKFAFFLAAMQEDTIAPPLGEMGLEEYVKMKLAE